MVHHRPAGKWTGYRGHNEGGADDAKKPAAVARTDKFANDRLCPDHEPSAADALNRPVGDEFRHGLRQGAQRRANNEEDQGALEDALAPKSIAEFAGQGHAAVAATR